MLGVLQASGEAGIRPAEIARRTGMSKRTVYRDLRALESELKFPVWSEGGRWGVQPGAFLPPLRLTLPEAMAVFLSARLVTRYADKYEPHLASAFQKLEEGLPDALREHVERTLDDLAARRVDEAFNRHVEDLTRAWAERRVVRFRYAPARYDGTEREPRWAEVRPYLLEPSLATHALYLIGHDETRDALRTFKVERIIDLSLTPRTFDAPGGRRARCHAAAGLGHHRGPAGDGGRAALRSLGQRTGARGDLASEPGGQRGRRRVARVAGAGRRARSRSGCGSCRGATRSRSSPPGPARGRRRDPGAGNRKVLVTR